MNIDPIAAKLALGAGLIGAAAGVIGAMAVLRRRALVGDALAHAALPGVCLGFLIAGARSPTAISLGALATGLLAVGLIALLRRWTRTGEDAALAVVLSTFFGAGVLMLSLIQHNPTGNQAGLNQYLFGEIAATTRGDILQLAWVAGVVIAAALVLHKEIKTWLFDEQFGRALGLPLFWIDWGVMALVAVVTVAALPVCGVVLTAGMLVYPAAAARFWTDRFGSMVILSGLIGALVASGGVLLASAAVSPNNPANWLLAGENSSAPPPGPTIVLLGGFVCLASLLFAPQRGMISRTIRRTQTQFRIATEHLLRRMFELSEAKLAQTGAKVIRPPGPYELRLPDPAPLDRAELLRPPAAAGWLGRAVLWSARRRGMIEEDRGGVFRLTQPGLQAAAAITRAHRLWELYLINQADIPYDHVHRAADDIEHSLPPELVERLEKTLAAEGMLPAEAGGVGVPSSPHATESPHV